MTKRFNPCIRIFILALSSLLEWRFGNSSGLPDKPSAEEDSPGTETISEEMRVKITGEDLYISAS